MTHLSTQQVIALSLLERVGNKTVMCIGEVHHEMGMNITTSHEMHEFLSMIKARVAEGRFSDSYSQLSRFLLGVVII